MPAEENSPVDCFRRRGQGASRREGIRQYAEKIPCSPPKMKKLYRKVWLFIFLFARDSNKEGAGSSSEENSPADCFRRRGQGASRREGIRQYAEKIPCSPPKMKKLYRKVWLFLFLFARDSNKEGAGFACGRKQSCGLFSPTRSRSIATRRHTAVCRKNPLLSAKNGKAVPQGMAFSFLFARDSNKEGAGSSSEENSPADCFRRRGQGASRREGIWQYAEKIPCSPPKMKKLYRKVWLFLFYLQGIRTRREQALPAEENSPVDCFRRRGQGASRREDIRQYAEKIPC